MAPAKAALEQAISENHTPSLVSGLPGFIGIGESPKYCTATFVAASTGSITCATRNGMPGQLKGRIITLTRTTEGLWDCTSDLDSLYKPRKFT
ncbi:pilin [Stutzerimonas xanthomarina]|uniref:pilin n=1 Tax=Stutzerimonas xanthomarina TaxID=271420 RepID=UPI0029B0E4BE|nr:pilin [Stutzerimonas xanthomarina]MDX2354318.1 pilin [Stutzerimonas xanthomarina]